VETYPIDIAAEQVVQWLLDESRVRPFDLLVRATRSYQAGELTGGESASLGEEERNEVSDIAEVGLIEVAPRRKPSQWILRVRVEDDIGPRLPEDEPVPEGEEEIDLQTFHKQFIAADRGIAEVSLDAESPAAKAQAERVLEAILTDRHQRGTGGGAG